MSKQKSIEQIGFQSGLNAAAANLEANAKDYENMAEKACQSALKIAAPDNMLHRRASMEYKVKASLLRSQAAQVRAL